MNKHQKKYENVKERLLHFAYEYLKTHEKEELRVSTICSSLKISRTTFYSHYQNTQELFEDLIVFLKKKNGEMIMFVEREGLSQNQLIKELFQKMISSYKKNYDFFNVLFKLIPFDSYGYWDYLYDALLQLDLFSTMCESKRRYFMRFITGGFLSILFKWKQDEFQKPEEEIYSLIIEMIEPFHPLDE